ncbi:MAG: 30S ribosomal protein S16 [Candidatus Woykebacteria bacterium GWB1_45_5]|uniref:Small ribosomal subunit protein bS16 n=2 Tax=Candidatus Woykeibacteriota TaxID=1817899 RepID=A0A1G1W3T4_9BACT|nr:MAG: 30S ribosomal protein S16 [Candidatus Woykebacteria bacterium GWA1_44_8]OGY24468.1 MAG: 30S ribosomal protein S16 [Candidatus Woykebacteria bacterium GWB1_45_5]
MLKIRLSRVGAKKKPKYRIVVADEQTKRDGKFLEVVGHYNPLIEPAEIKVVKERYNHWLSTGAQPTKSVINLFKRYEKVSRASR